MLQVHVDAATLPVNMPTCWLYIEIWDADKRKWCRRHETHVYIQSSPLVLWPIERRDYVHRIRFDKCSGAWRSAIPFGLILPQTAHCPGSMLPVYVGQVHLFQEHAQLDPTRPATTQCVREDISTPAVALGWIFAAIGSMIIVIVMLHAVQVRWSSQTSACARSAVLHEKQGAQVSRKNASIENIVSEATEDSELLMAFPEFHDDAAWREFFDTRIYKKLDEDDHPGVPHGHCSQSANEKTCEKIDTATNSTCSHQRRSAISRNRIKIEDGRRHRILAEDTQWFSEFWQT